MHYYVTDNLHQAIDMIALVHFEFTVHDRG